MSRSAITAHLGSFPISLWATLVALSAGLLLFSQTLAFHGDEGFHLLAAQLINAGKRPYVDFFYQHVPLYAYLNAGVFLLFGDSWRMVHAFSALFSAACILLVADFVSGRMPEGPWRVASAATAAFLVGLHGLVIQYATVGLPYGLCLFLLVAAFRLVIGAAGREAPWLAGLGGLCAGAAAASSLLTAPVVPMLFLWVLRHNRSGNRVLKATSFLAGAAVPFLPVLWLAIEAPHPTIFNIVEYHLFYRQSSAASLTEALKEDLTTVYHLWLESAQGVVLVLVAAVGLVFLYGRKEWEAARRAEYALGAWLTGGLGVYLACTAPTFPQYFVLVVPFLAILASVGVSAIGLTMWARGRPGTVVLLIVGFFAVGLAKPAYQYGRNFESLFQRWQSYGDIAREVNRVTPKDGEVWAEDEFIYFVAQRVPPIGLGNTYAQNLDLPSELAGDLPVATRAQQDEWLAAGRFATVVLELGDPRGEALGLPRLYAGQQQMHGVRIFWGRGRTSVESPPCVRSCG